MDPFYDAIVIGAGPAGEVCAGRLGDAGKRVAIVESERVGGECAFWACIPSKTLLRSAEPYADAKRVPGSCQAVGGRLSFDAAAAWRNENVSDYDDTEHVPWLSQHHVELIRGEAHVEQRDAVRVGEKVYRCEALVIATGSTAHVPDIQGLTDGRYWTSREATSAQTVPRRLLIVGAGAVGVEMGQVFARYGSEVTLVEPGAQILAHEEPEVADVLAKGLQREKLTIKTGTSATKVVWSGALATVQLSNGETIEADAVLVATGRTPRTDLVAAEVIGLRLNHGAIQVDDRCRATQGVYAIGDVNGIAQFTHVAKYQGRIAADTILGREAKARYDAVPRCTFTDPEIASTGVSERQARERNIACAVGSVPYTSCARANVYFETPAEGLIKLVADKQRRMLIGAAIAGPLASEMIGIASAAILSRTTVDELLQVIQPFPTLSEAFFYALEAIKW